MDKQILALGHIGANCYLLSSDNSAIVIDPGKYSKQAEDFLLENSSKKRIILLTHAHFDHIGGADLLRKNTDTKIAIGEFDAPALKDGAVNLSDAFHAHVAPFDADILLKDGEMLKIGDTEVTVIHTPGHTVGGVCFYINGELFSGDTLFYESIGRTDFPGGSFGELNNTIMKLYTGFDDETIIYPGHGETTTIGHEKKYNPFVRDI